MQMQMQMLSVHSTIEILRTQQSVDAFANADENAQWERNLSPLDFFSTENVAVKVNR